MRILLAVCFLLLSQWSFAQSIGMWGSPPMRNFRPADYRAGLANWSTTQDRRGVLYFGNDKGILTYDGAHWQLVRAGGATIRAVATDPQGRVWAGGTATFGYLAPDSTGALSYVSLAHLIPVDHQPLGEIWTVQCLGNSVVFQSDNYLYLFDGKKLTSVAAESFFTFGYVAGGEYFVQQNGSGLWRLAGEKLALMPGTSALGSSLISQVLPLDNGRFLLAVQGLGLYQLDQSSAKPYPTQADAILQDFRVYAATWLPAPGGKRWLALGLLGIGVVILQEDGKIAQILNRRNGLVDDFILALWPDAQGGLWVGTYRGLSRVEVAAPLTSFNESLHNLRGTVNAVAKLKDDWYVATSFGLQKAVPRELTHTTAVERFYDAEFGLLRGGKTECWDLLPVDDDLLIGCFDGVKVLRDGVVSQLSEDMVPPNVHCLVRSRLDGNRVFAGSAFNLRALYRTNGQWADEGEIENLTEEIYQLQEDKAGNLWVSTVNQGVFRLTFGKGQKYEFSLKPDIMAVGKAKGLPVLANNGLFMVNGEIRVVAGPQVLKFNESDQRLVPDPAFAGIGQTQLTALLTDSKGNLRVFYDQAGRSRAGLLKLEEDGQYTLHHQPRIPDGLLDPGHLNQAETQLWFGDLAGLYRFAIPTGKDSTVLLPAPIIRRVWITGKDSLLANDPDPAKPLSLGQGVTRLRFDFAAPLFNGSTPAVYQWALGGPAEPWSEWTTETWAAFQQLPPGDYVFRVRARDGYGHVTPITQVAVRVRSLWYDRAWVYALLGVALLVGAMVGYKKLIAKSITEG